MKRFLRLLAILMCSAGFSLILVSCSSTSSGTGKLYDPGYGPFDKHGTYLEGLADAPAKQNRPPNMGSISAGTQKKSKSELRRERKEAERLAKERKKQAEINARLAEKKAKEDAKLAKIRKRQLEQSSDRYGLYDDEFDIPSSSSTTVSTIASQPVTTIKPVVKQKPKPKVAQSQPKPKPQKKTEKPKPKVVKKKAKPKPKPVVKVAPKVKFHTVRKGDTLYNISRKYGISVSKVKAANGISGNLIRLGQTLKIPK